jgi:hypothetical protein
MSDPMWTPISTGTGGSFAPVSTVTTDPSWGVIINGDVFGYAQAAFAVNAFSEGCFADGNTTATQMWNDIDTTI